MCLSLCACGSKGITLTLDNYDDYISVAKYFHSPTDGENTLFVGNLGPYGIAYDGGSTLYLGKCFDAQVVVKGSSSNFIYEDVVVTVKAVGDYKTYSLSDRTWDNGGNTFEEEFVIDCNVSGDGRLSKSISAKPYVHDKMANVKWEVVAISGRVVPAG